MITFAPTTPTQNLYIRFLVSLICINSCMLFRDLTICVISMEKSLSVVEELDVQNMLRISETLYLCAFIENKRNLRTGCMCSHA